MKLTKFIEPISASEPDDLFIVSASFEEERCLAASRLLHNYRVKCSIVVNFESKLNPRGEAKKERTAEELLTIAGRCDVTGAPRHLLVAGYDVVGLSRELKAELRGRGMKLNNLKVTLDVSCLTKIQLAGILRLLIGNKLARHLRIVYSYPREYNTSGWDRYSKLATGFSSPIVLPIQGLARSAAETETRLAIVLVGHEGERTFAAWRSADAEMTWLIEGESVNHKVMETCRLENHFLYDYIRGGSSHAKFSIGSLDLEGAVANLGAAFDAKERWQNTQISVVPFGPKPLLIGLLVAILTRPRLHAQLVYPITTTYNSEYSSGVEGVYSSHWESDLGDG